MATVLRPPLVLRVEAAKPAASIHSGSSQSLVLAELRGKDRFFTAAGQGPDYDWPNPRGPQRSISLLTWTDSFKLGLLGKDSFFTGPGQGPDYDWPNPRGWPRPLHVITWTNSFPLELRGQDRFFGGPGQVSDNQDQPNPRGPVFPAELRTWLSQSSPQLRVVAVPPPANYDWPVPRGAVPAIDLRTWIDRVKLTLIGADTFFAGAGQGPDYDWPNPRGAQFPGHLWASIQRSILPPAAVAQPFAQYDWNVPKGVARGDVGHINFTIPPTTPRAVGGTRRHEQGRRLRREYRYDQFDGSLTRKRWEELQALLRAEREAAERADNAKRPKERAALDAAADAAREAIEAGAAEYAQAAELKQLTRALAAATQANTLAAVIRQANAAALYAQRIVAEIKDEEDAIALLLT